MFDNCIVVRLIVGVNLWRVFFLSESKDDEELLEDSTMPFFIQGFDVAEPEKMSQLMENAKTFDGYVLIDCPGNMKDDGLIPILTQADYIVCPFRYDQKTLTSTGSFVTILLDILSPLKEVRFLDTNMIQSYKKSARYPRKYLEVRIFFSIFAPNI